MPNLSKSSKILIASAIFLLAAAVVLFIINKNKSSKVVQPNAVSTGNSNQAVPALPQSAPQNNGTKMITPPVQEPPAGDSFSIEKQTAYSYDAIKENPTIENSVRGVKGDFKLDNIGVSFPSATTKLKNGDEITLFSGCTPHNCGDTNMTIAYDNNSGKSYVLVERLGTAVGYEIYGAPSDEIRNLLVYYFLHQ